MVLSASSEITGTSTTVEAPSPHVDEFSWEDYFARTGALAVDVGAFYHVECSHQPLDLTECDSQEKSKDTKVAIDWIETERFVDIQDEQDPRRVWPAEILENVGGRLYLKYVCLPDYGQPFWEFYLSERVHPAGVCSTEIGKQLGLYYALPSSCDNSDLNLPTGALDELLDTTKQHTLDASIFQARPTLQQHQFETGMWLEAIDPVGGSILYPAQVIDVLNSYYFIIEYDTSMINEGSPVSKSSGPLRRACHARSPGLFQIGFAGQRGLGFAAPESFDWATYLRTKGGKMATERCFPRVQSDDRFIPGRRLEAVNPTLPHQICAATVVKRIENLLWLHFDSCSELPQIYIYVTDCGSTRIFPCGWCAANGNRLMPPYDHNLKDFKIAQEELRPTLTKYTANQDLPLPSSSSNDENEAFMPEFWIPGIGCEWSPAIYINAHCFTGSHIDRMRLSAKPQQIGPGPMVNILKEVGESIISSSFRPREVLAELQSAADSENVFFRQIEIKAKYRLKRWKGVMDVCVNSKHIPEWCHRLCVRLEVCPGLLSFKPQEKCPFECNRPTRIRRLGLAKPLSGLAAKRMKKRLAVQEKRREEAGRRIGLKQFGQRSGGSAGPTRKRSRQMTYHADSSSSAKEDLNRPVTRLAKLRSSRLRSDERREQQSAASYFPPSNGIGECGATESASENSEMPALHNSSHGLHPCNCLCGYSEDGSRSSTPFKVYDEYALDGVNTDENGQHMAPISINLTIPPVQTDPLYWTPNQLHQWLHKTVISVGIADQLREELVDGQAFMLMGIRDVQEYLGLKLGPALKVCGVIKELKKQYLEKYAGQNSQDSHSFVQSNGCRAGLQCESESLEK